MILRTVEQSSAEEKIDWGVIKEKIRTDLKRYLNKQTSKRPLILPVILEVWSPCPRRKQHVQATQIALRPILSDDFESLYEIDQACYPPDIAYSRPNFATTSAFPMRIALIAVDRGKRGGLLSHRVSRTSRAHHHHGCAGSLSPPQDRIGACSKPSNRACANRACAK